MLKKLIFITLLVIFIFMAEQIIDPFIQVVDVPLTPSDSYGNTTLQNLSNLQIGAGNIALKADSSGLWLGADRFADAPFNVDMNGNVNAQSIKLSNTLDIQSAQGLNQVFTNGTPVDVTNGTITFTLERTTIVLFLVSDSGWVYQGGSGDWVGRGIIRLILDNNELLTNKARTLISGYTVGADSSGAVGGGNPFSSSVHYMNILTAGTHTIKLTGAVDSSAGTPYFNLYHFTLSVITLGTP